MKVYAVKVGRQPGIYETWAACEAQVKGVSGAEYKSFATADLARAWLAGVNAPSSSSTPADNNRMELLAAIAGLEALKRPSTVTIVTDSRYLAEGVMHIERQKRSRDLWERLAVLLRTHIVRWEWVKGHAGHAENERCDALARAAIASGNLLEDTGYRP
jgi:ribonuclease HI